MARGRSPLLGYNTNVRHKGRVFHIQTEDSGVAHPHVITHLFADGGRIIKSHKTAYAELLEAADMQAQVKKIMQDQHKAMFIALRDGQFDHLIDPAGTEARTATVPEGLPIAAPPVPPAPRSADSTAAYTSMPSMPSMPAIPAVPPRAASLGAMPAVRPPGPPGAVAPPPPPPVPPGPVAAPPPPPPAAVAAPPAPVPVAAPPAPPAVPAPAAAPVAAAATTGASADRTGSHTAQRNAGSSGRYATVRAPEILGSFKSKPAEGASIFGDGLMSEKSLDEVILAYLAEDLDETKR
jgi:hypothetical protein